jgi:acetyl esterase/lipase
VLEIVLVTGAVVLAIVLAVVAAFRLSPWPAVLLIRRGGDDGMGAAREHEALVPAGIARHLDVPYGRGRDELIDVFVPEDAATPLPAIVWVHGGGFVAGTKRALQPYLALLASHGFAVVNVEYTKAPTAAFPAQALQLDAVLHFLADNADRWHIDPTRLVLAGDSAGAHIAGTTALAISDPHYASAAGALVGTRPEQVRGVILVSGPYDMKIRAEKSPFAWYLRTIMWAYSGTKRLHDDPRGTYLSLVDHVGPTYPPAFVTTGPADPLLPQSVRLADRLRQAGAPVEVLFFDPETTDAAIGHEYQLQLEAPEAREAMRRMVAFARQHTNATPRPGLADT